MRIESSARHRLVISLLLASCWGCSRPEAPPAADKGPHGGKLLAKDGFAVEVKIFEQGVPPEFRLYGFEGDKSVGPDSFAAVITRSCSPSSTPAPASKKSSTCDLSISSSCARSRRGCEARAARSGSVRSGLGL